MQDMKSHLEKLRVQLAECEIIRDLASDSNKRELFTRLAAHFKVLAGEVEQAIIREEQKDNAPGSIEQQGHSIEAKRFRDKAAEAQQLSELAESETRRDVLSHISDTYLRTAEQIEGVAKVDRSIEPKESKK